MSILGIDYGSSKIGLAKSDREHKMAFPIEVLKNTSKEDVLKRIKEICESESIDKIIIGVPVSLAGEIREVDLENQQMNEVLEFVDWLKKEISLPIETEDERMSTKMANSLGKGMIKNGSDDDVAAMVILQSYLDKLN